ncbi:MAG: S8 family serine peptidase [Bacteriovoracaceae bacterium]|nr:S8 family serine peptidase [Bacteriovoracaceae bacterium]
MKWVILFFLFMTFDTQAVTVAVIDTGFDIDHEILRPRLKLGETDEEGAIALPGFAGWNFTDNTHLKTPLIQGEILQDVLLYRSLKAKSHQQGLSPEERIWLEKKASDPSFKEKLRLFKKLAHGTLVTGILLKDTIDIDVFPVRGLGIEIPTVVVESNSEPTSPILKHSQAEFERQVKLSRDRILRKMRKMLSWIDLHKIRVVNASYGVTEKHIKSRFAEWHKEITGLDLEEIKLNEIVDSYFDSLYTQGKKIIERYPHILFIFSAGNSHQDNDLHHHFPSRILSDHAITVAAMNGNYLAQFSNWGQKHVDMAAPGVAILSFVPTAYAKESGMSETPASGTSMAAPTVSNLAARCLQNNEKLTAKNLKLLLESTGESVPDLANKTATGKVIDVAKALRASELSKELPLTEAIKFANSGLIPSRPKPEDPAKAILNVLPHTQTIESDDPTDITPISPSSSSPDQEIKTPGKSLPPLEESSSETPQALSPQVSE